MRFLDLNYSQVKRLSDLELVKMMLSPHISPRLYGLLRYLYSRKPPTYAEIAEMPNGAEIAVNVTFAEQKEEQLSFGVSLLETYA